MNKIKYGFIGIVLLMSILLALPVAAQQVDQQQAVDQPEEQQALAMVNPNSLDGPLSFFSAWRWPEPSPLHPQFGFGRVPSTSMPDTIPPLPFDNPQIGPLIKPQMEAIETRSRAFVPKLTDGTEGFEFPADLSENERWIRVDLTAQSVTAYEGETPVRSFLVSTGVPGFDTVTGEFRVRMKVSEQTMSGGEPGTPGYYSLPNVKWVMYFYAEYALHGSYWHDNFGNPMSHGCVNMTNADAKWLFDFAGPAWDGEQVWYKSSDENPGSRVVVHY